MSAARTPRGLRAVAMVIMALILVAGIVGCGSRSAPQPTTSTPAFVPKRVVVTTPQLAEFTRIIGGSRVEVTQLVGNDVDPHTYVLTPRDVTAIASADLVVVNGLGLDLWLTDRWEGLDHHATLVDASVGIQPRRATPLGTGAVDPHAWMDPVLAKLIVANVADALVRMDPEGDVTFGANSRAYQGQLQSLSDSFRGTFAPYVGQSIVVSHDALGYLADRVGLRIAGSIDEDFSRTPRDAAGMAALTEVTKSTRAMVVVDGVSTELAAKIANDAGVRLFGNVTSPGDTGGASAAHASGAVLADGISGSYLETMTANQAVLLAAMRPAP